MKNKITRGKLIEMVIEGPVFIRQCPYSNRDLFFSVHKVNSENFDLSPMLTEQLKKEGKYDTTYIAIVNDKQFGPHGMDILPIYGNSDKYVTKHFVSTPKEAAADAIRDMKLVKQVNGESF